MNTKRQKTRTTTKKGNTQSTSRKRRKRTPEERRKHQIGLLIQGIFLGLCICLLCFSLYKLGSIFFEYQSGEKEYADLRQYLLEEPTSPEDVVLASADGENAEGEEAGNPSLPMTRVDLPSLQEINTDAIGWIEIGGTSISYPMLYTTDNSYYLTHTFSKEKNKSGAIFVEAANKADFSDMHTIVYGHNMKDGSMFAGLKNYSKASYFEAHPYIYVDLSDGSHCYQIFSCHEANTSDVTYTVGFKADETYQTFLDSLKDASLYDTGVEVSQTEQVITLSTCTKSGTKRFVVHAKKVY